MVMTGMFDLECEIREAVIWNDTDSMLNCKIILHWVNTELYLKYNKAKNAEVIRKI